MANTRKKRSFTFYCKQQGGTAVGCEISETEKRAESEEEYVKAEGRVALRFFNAGQDKSTQLRVLLEAREAFGVFIGIARIVRSAEPVKLKLVVHDFDKGGKETCKTLCGEKWARNGKEGYALTLQRDKISHNVSFSEADFLYAGEALRFLSTLQGYQIVPLAAPGNGDYCGREG